MLNVAVINGGRGAAGLISKLLEKPYINLTSIVNAYDDGKSTGEIRRFFEMLGPSDIRKVQQLMLPLDDPNYLTYKKLFDHRFSKKIKRDQVFKELKNYLSNDNSTLVGEKINSEYVNKYLKEFLNIFLNTLSSIEKLREKKFNFKRCQLYE